MTDRRVHYLLLNDPPLRHDKKAVRYANTLNDYKAVCDLLVRARVANIIPDEAIEDSTRPVQLGDGFESFDQFIEQELDNFLCGYSRNLQQGQPHHIEIILEKMALRSVCEAVARQYNTPMTTGRGFASYPPRKELYRRFRRSGKQKLVLLFLTDHDPDGETIASSFTRLMRDDFGVSEISMLAVKVALTADDVKAYDLPSDLDAKPSSPNYKKFTAKYGTKAVELDAAPVALLQKKLHEAIQSVMDIDSYNAQVELERKDAAHIEAYRSVVIEAIKGATARGAT